MNDAIQGKLAELQAKFASGVKDRLAEIRGLFGQLTPVVGTDAATAKVAALETTVHKLSGLSGTLSFHETHKASRALELACDGLRTTGEVVTDVDVKSLKDLFVALEAAVEEDQRSPHSDGTSAQAASAQKGGGAMEEITTILLVEDDPLQAEALQMQLANLGFRVNIVSGPDELETIDFSQSTAPAIVLMDIMIGEDRDAGLRVVREMRAADKLNVPVIFTTARNDINARIEAVRGGGDGYVVKPVNITDLLETIKRLTGVPDTGADDVLIVGATEETADEFLRLLDGTEMAGRLVADPADILDALESRKAEVILMNTVFQDCTGDELASMVRQVNDELARIPIVFFTETTPEKSHLLKLRASGDDLLVLPVDPDLFVLSLSSRCRRTRRLREIVKQRRASEQRFHAIFETASDAILTTDASGHIIFWNSGAERMFGGEANQIIGVPVSRFFPNRHHDMLSALGPGNGVGRAAEAIEMTGLRRDGTEFPIEVSAAEWATRDASFIGYVIRDISKRKKTEDSLETHRRELAEKSRVLQATMDSIDQGFVVWDETYNMLAHSQRCLDFWYDPPPEAVAPGVSMLHLMRHLASGGAFGEGDAEILAEQQFERVVTAGDQSSEELVLLDNRILDIHRFPFPSGGYVAIYTDVTEQKNSEEALTRTANELQKILATTSQGYWRFNNFARTIEVNPRMAAILGVDPDDVRGTTIYDYLNVDQAALEKDKLEKLASGVSESYELVLTNADGLDVPCMFYATPVHDDTGHKTGSFVLVSDISDYKRDQAALEEAMQQQQKANRAKSEFLSSMSHELRTPLNAILGFGQMLELDAEELMNADQQESVSQIMKGGRHLLDLINDILDLSKIEAGIVDLEFREISPGEIIDECLDLIGTMADVRGISLSVENKASGQSRILADYTRLKQVLLNLMSNAVKYNSPKGAISVRLEDIANSRFRISVTDTGAGLPENKRHRLFQPFSRLGAENTDIEGTGIGLVVTKNLIEHMNGTVTMESEVGKGSTFSVDLPSTRSGAAAGKQGDEASPSQAGATGQSVIGKLLYVEDNPANILLMERIIARIPGLEMITAPSGEVGLDLALSENPDIIILDINLPGISGIEALARLREMDETRDTPVLAMSAAATKPDIERGMAAGFLHYLTKPIDIAKVVGIIRGIIEK